MVGQKCRAEKLFPSLSLLGFVLGVFFDIFMVVALHFKLPVPVLLFIIKVLNKRTLLLLDEKKWRLRNAHANIDV